MYLRYTGFLALFQKHTGDFLVVQWLRLRASNAGAQAQFLVGELKSHMYNTSYNFKKRHMDQL